MAQYLSDSIVKRLPLPAHHDVTTKDTLVRGFGIRVTAAGARSFTLNYRRKADGRQRRLTIGTFPDWSTVQAREEAKRLKRAIDNGGDPVGEQEGIRTAPTIADLCQRFIADYLPRKRATTQRVYKPTDRSRHPACLRPGQGGGRQPWRCRSMAPSLEQARADPCQ